MSATGRSFFPGHEDGEKTHTPGAQNWCVRCGIDLNGRTDLRFEADPPPPGSLAALKLKAQQHAQQAMASSPLLDNRYNTVTETADAAQVSDSKVRNAIRSALTDQQIETVKVRTEQTIAIALFHTDPRVHAFLLIDPKNDDVCVMQKAMAVLWKENTHGWRKDAEARAAKMVEIIGASQRRKGP